VLRSLGTRDRSRYSTSVLAAPDEPEEGRDPMSRTSTPAALLSRIASLEARLVPAAPVEPNPFMHQNVVAEVEQAEREYQARLGRIAERWREAPEDFAPWESRPPIEKQITAATPEQAAEASRALQRLQEEALLAESEFVRRRREQYFAAYEWQRRHQARAE
jgi:hypothetical protein